MKKIMLCLIALGFLLSMSNNVKAADGPPDNPRQPIGPSGPPKLD